MEYRYRDASEMKDSGVEWIGKIPKDWKVSRIKNFTSLRSIKGKENEQLLSLYRDYGVVPKNSRDDNFNRASEDLSNYKYVEKDNLVLNKMKVWQGSLAVSQFKGIVSPAYIICELNSSKIVPRYAHYSLRNKKYIPEYRRLSTGIRPNQWDINYEDFKNIKGTLPKLNEQEKIANFLDNKTSQFDSIISKKEALIEKLEEAKKSLISEVVTGKVKVVKTDDGYELVKRNSDEMKDSGVEWLGEIPKDWDITKLKYIGQAITGLTYSPNNIVNENEGTLVLRSSNVQNGRIVDEDSVYVNMDIPKKLITREGDIIICSRNGSRALIGKNACIEKEYVGKTFGAFMTIFRSKYYNYLNFVFNSNIFKAQSGSFLTSTINQLTIGNLNSFIIAIPSKQEQNFIVKYLDEKTSKYNSIIDKIHLEMQKLKEAKQSLISEAVTGKIEILD